jgi:hypothetical protein
MDRGRVGEDRGSKETDGCPLTECTSLRSISIEITGDARFNSGGLRRLQRGGYRWQ